MSDHRNIRRVYAVLTSQCNLRCSYCYENDKKDGSMSWRVLRDTVDFALNSKRDKVHIVFYGGEPLLEIELMRKAVQYAKQNCPDDKDLTFGITTNGLLVTDEASTFMVENEFDLQISFDGVPAAQAYRGTGTFVALDDLLTRLRSREPAFFRGKLNIGVTLLPQTIRYLADSVEYLISKDVPAINVSPSFSGEAFWKPDYYDVLQGQFDRVLDMSIDHYRATGEIPFVMFRGAPAKGGNGNGTSTWSMCGVMRGETPTVDIDGGVHGCATFADSYQAYPSEFLKTRLEPLKIGSFQDKSFASRYSKYGQAARRAEIFGGKEKKHSSYGRCGACEYLPSCSVCPISIGNIPGNEDPHRVPDFLCAYNLISLACADRFVKECA